MQYNTLYLTENDCYKRGEKITPKGIVVHSTGANNPNLKRYVGPDDGVLGHNPHNNHWNRAGIEKCVHAFIGYDRNKLVCCYNTLPWNHRSWGCGNGQNGSYNNSHIQFEICEDNLGNERYFNEAFKIAIDLCAYLCKEFNISVSNIVSHREAHSRGYASNHSDPHNWLGEYDWTMDTFREKVSQKIRNINNTVGSEVGVDTSFGVVVVTYSGPDGLNIRSAPEIADNVVRIAYEGEELEAVEQIRSWYKLADGNYVIANSQYVSFRR